MQGDSISDRHGTPVRPKVGSHARAQERSAIWFSAADPSNERYKPRPPRCPSRKILDSRCLFLIALARTRWGSQGGWSGCTRTVSCTSRCDCAGSSAVSGRKRGRGSGAMGNSPDRYGGQTSGIAATGSPFGTQDRNPEFRTAHRHLSGSLVITPQVHSCVAWTL